MRPPVAVLRLAFMLAVLLLVPFGGRAMACDHSVMRGDSASLSAVRMASRGDVAEARSDTVEARPAIHARGVRLPSSKPPACCGAECCISHVATAVAPSDLLTLAVQGRHVLSAPLAPPLHGLSLAPDPDPPRVSL